MPTTPTLLPEDLEAPVRGTDFGQVFASKANQLNEDLVNTVVPALNNIATNVYDNAVEAEESALAALESEGNVAQHLSDTTAVYNSIQQAISDLNQNVLINDTTPASDSLYSSEKVEQAVLDLIDDSITDPSKTWSSSKVLEEVSKGGLGSVKLSAYEDLEEGYLASLTTSGDVLRTTVSSLSSSILESVTSTTSTLDNAVTCSLSDTKRLVVYMDKATPIFKGFVVNLDSEGNYVSSSSVQEVGIFSDVVSASYDYFSVCKGFDETEAIFAFSGAGIDGKISKISVVGDVITPDSTCIDANPTSPSNNMLEPWLIRLGPNYCLCAWRDNTAGNVTSLTTVYTTGSSYSASLYVSSIGSYYSLRPNFIVDYVNGWCTFIFDAGSANVARTVSFNTTTGAPTSSGSTISLSSLVNQGNPVDITDLGDNYFILSYRDSGDSYTLRVALCHQNSTTSISVINQTAITTTNISLTNIMITSSYNDPVGGKKLFLLQPSRQYVLAFGDSWSNTPVLEYEGAGSVIKNTDATKTSPLSRLSDGSMIYVDYPSSSTLYIYKSIPPVSTVNSWFGVVASSALEGEEVSIYKLGDVATGISGLTVNSTYYLNTATGSLTTTATSVEVGRAVATDRLLITGIRSYE